MKQLQVFMYLVVFVLSLFFATFNSLPIGNTSNEIIETYVTGENECLVRMTPEEYKKMQEYIKRDSNILKNMVVFNQSEEVLKQYEERDYDKCVNDYFFTYKMVRKAYKQCKDFNHGDIIINAGDNFKDCIRMQDEIATNTLIEN